MTDEGSSPPGTVYGRGGVDVRERGLHPAVVALVALAGIGVVAAIGYLVFRSPPGGRTSPPAAAAAASAPPSPAEPAPSEAAPVPEQFGTGSWLISPTGDPRLQLSADGDFAAFSSDDPQVLTVVPGLAGQSCFTFRREDGKYLRHFDYRLRFDAEDGSDLFRDDATFCPEGDAPVDAFRLHSKNYPDYVLHRRGAQLYIDKPDGSGDFIEDSSFTVLKPR